MDKPLRQLDYSEDDLRKIQQRKKEHEGSKVEPEWFFVAKFGKHFGWQAVEWLLDNERGDMDVAVKLMEAANKVDAQTALSQADASFFGAASAQSKKPGNTFNSLTKSLREHAKVSE